MTTRSECLGGSDVGAVLGLSPYRTPLDVYCEKKGLRDPQEETAPMLWGTILEKPIAEHFAARHGVKLRNTSRTYRDRKHPWAVAHPDRLIVKMRAGLEVKTAGVHSAKAWGDDGETVPAAYQAQVHWYSRLCGWEVAWLAVVIGGQDYRDYLFEADPDLQHSLFARCRHWWQQHIVEDSPPPATPADSDAVNDLFPSASDDVITDPSPEALALVQQLKRTRRALKRLDSRKKAQETRLKEIIGEAEGIETPEGTVTWKETTPRPSYKAALEELVALKYISQGVATDFLERTRLRTRRRLVVPRKWTQGL